MANCKAVPGCAAFACDEAVSMTLRPEHFGIVSVDCAKSRSKWMLCDFYGNVVIPPTVVEHNRGGLEEAITQIRQALPARGLHDCLVVFPIPTWQSLPFSYGFLFA